MNSLVQDTTGLAHLISSVFALILGTMVLASTKGTRLHKLIGYAYTLSMVIMIGTAFNLYNLFGRWGPFHYAALLSTSTLLTGFIPAILRFKYWLRWHLAGMYFSIIGLYSAFVSEVVTRIPGLPFFPMVVVGTATVTAIGVFFYLNKKDGWLQLK